MNFAQQVKKDLCALPLEVDGCSRAELAGLLSPNSRLVVDEDLKPQQLIFKTETPSVAGRFFRLVKLLTNDAPTVKVEKQNRFKNRRVICIVISKNIRTLLKELRLMKNNTLLYSANRSELVRGIPVFYSSKQRYLTAFLRGVFLSCGSMADPEKGYRLELNCKSKLFLESVGNVLAHYDIKTYFTTRKESPVLLSKEAESVVNFLGLIGANKALFDIENVRAMKEIRNVTNRRVNADIANINKVHDAAEKHIAAIDKIEGSIGLNALSPVLKELAVKRKENPDMSLVELGELMDPPMGKSGVYRRLNKLMTIASELGNH